MYNRYIPSGASYSRIVEEDMGCPHGGNDAPFAGRTEPNSAAKNPLEGITDFLGGLFKGLDLSEIDTGDILLVLIILFLFLEGDNIELVISLGLLLLFGLGDKKKKDDED